jgi:hypothetical protein
MSSYIPQNEEGFNGFQRNFMNQLTPIAAAAGIPASQVNDLIDYQTAWTNAYAAGGKAAKSSRDSAEVKTKYEAWHDYEYSKSPLPLGLRAFIAAWVVCNPLISDEQRVAMRVPIHKKKKTNHTTATQNTVVFKSRGLGGGVIQTICSSSGSPALNPMATNSNAERKIYRPKKEEGYDIQKSWKIINKGDALPASANDAGMNKTVFTKANFIQQLGQQNEGMLLCEFMQWFNPRHPELAGPWSNLQTTIIT